MVWCVTLVGKADLLSAHFDSNQSGDSVDLPSTCHQSPMSHNFRLHVTGGVTAPVGSGFIW